MKRTWVVMLALMSIAPTFSVWAQSASERSTTVTDIRKVFPDSVRVGIADIIITSRGFIFAGAGPGGYIWRSPDYGNSWAKLTEGLTWPAADALIETDSGSILAGNVNGIYRSTDNGETWSRRFVDTIATWILAFTKNREGHIFASSAQAPRPLFRSTDDGVTWTRLAEGVFDSSGVQGLCISQEGWLYMGAVGFMPTPPRERGEGVFRSTDNGETWSAINSGLPVISGQIPIWPVATGQSGYVYAGVLKGGIYRSTDRGDTWQESNGNMSERYPTALLTTEEGFVAAGFEDDFPNKGGVYWSFDRGNFWHYLGLEKKGIIWSFAFARDSSFLFVGTHQDGVWRITLNLITKVEEVDNIPSSFALHQNYPNPFNPSTTIQFTLPERGFARLTVVNILGQEVATLVAEEVSAGTHKTTWDASGFPSGIYFMRFEASSFIATKKMLLVK